MPKNIFITGIGTEIGKTVCSAIITEALNADYWKPIQAGSAESTDSDFIRKNISNKNSIIHPEKHLLKHPLSPHHAAELEGIEITLNDFNIPITKNNIIIEGAGGLMVPINKKQLVIDLISYLKCEVILVSKNYLGSINHTLLSIEALRKRNIAIAGIIFNGNEYCEGESFILNNSTIPLLGRLLPEKNINNELISSYAAQWKNNLLDVFRS